MKVIGAGFGRTGTLSLRQALEELGYGPCYHMENVLLDSHGVYWQSVIDGKPPQWDTFLGDFGAGVDAPVCLYVEELMATYPDAKVVLTTRDPDRWYDSVAESIYHFTTLPNWMRRLPKLGQFLQLTHNMIWNGFFDGRFEDRAFAIAQFNQHSERMMRLVPADKLLVFHVSEGWEPLCRFLDKPLPNKPFPHVNDRAEMKRAINHLRLIGRVGPYALVGLFALLIWLLLR